MGLTVVKKNVSLDVLVDSDVLVFSYGYGFRWILNWFDISEVIFAHILLLLSESFSIMLFLNLWNAAIVRNFDGVALFLLFFNRLSSALCKDLIYSVGSSAGKSSDKSL